MYIYIYILYICRPLPELGRARLQLQSSNTILQNSIMPSCRLHPTGLQTAGSSLLLPSSRGVTNPPQAATGRRARVPTPPYDPTKSP